MSRVTAPPRTPIGPADHGRKLSARAIEAAEYMPGFNYEIIAGKIYVSPVPNPPEHILERWLGRALDRYSDARPDVVNFIAARGRVFVPASTGQTVPEPDIAAYNNFPLDADYATVNWRAISPFLVAEVLVDGSIDKDLGRNPPLYLAVPSIREYWVLNGSVNPNEPSLIQHRRRGKTWLVRTTAYRGVFTTPLLPGFSLVIDPRAK